MSIFDPPQVTLSPAIFDKNQIMHPEIKEYLMYVLQSFFPKEKTYRLALVGSLATHQYTETSDVDVQVMGTNGELYDTWHAIFKAFNERELTLPGTQHPITFFFVEYIAPDRQGNWEHSQAAYDMFLDTWLKKPLPYDKIGDPKDKFAREFQYVKMVLLMIESEISTIRKSLALKDRDKALQSLKTLQQFFKKIETDRKDSFRWGGGAPSTGEDNVIYKILEHGRYGKLLKDLVD